MSTNSNDQGRAYEYAWIMALYESLRAVRRVRIMDNSSLEADKRAWENIPNKEDEVYAPLLWAFMQEIKRAYAHNPYVPQKMVEYLIGIDDYYKAVSHDAQRLTMIHTFNLHQTLNQPSKVKISAISVPKVELPTELKCLDFKTGSKNIVEMYLNNGWQLSFRIHNASKIVEPSLKFDIQFVGMPPSILNIECKWGGRN